MGLKAQSTGWQKAQFPIILSIFQVVMIGCYAYFVDYTPGVGPLPVTENETLVPDTISALSFDLATNYPVVQELHVMTFIRIGFMLIFIKVHGTSGILMILMMMTVLMQWAMLVRGLIAYKGASFPIGLTECMRADFAAGGILVSFAAAGGMLNPLQMLIMAIIEVPIFLINDHITLQIFEARDVGAGITLQVFACYFGLCCSMVLYNKEKANRISNAPQDPLADVLAMIGTVITWLFFPSYNGALGVTDGRYRASVNTFLSVLASTCVVFMVHMATRPNPRFHIVSVHAATLAGGVAMGTLSEFVIKPYAALLVGSLAGLVSLFGFGVLQNSLVKIRVYDTCGVNNVSGMPGIITGIGSAIATALATPGLYGQSYTALFPSVAQGTRTISEQAWYQLAALGTCLGFGIVGGFLTGVILLIPFIHNRNAEKHVDLLVSSSSTSSYDSKNEDLTLNLPGNMSPVTEKKESSEILVPIGPIFKTDL